VQQQDWTSAAIHANALYLTILDADQILVFSPNVTIKFDPDRGHIDEGESQGYWAQRSLQWRRAFVYFIVMCLAGGLSFALSKLFMSNINRVHTLGRSHLPLAYSNK
jgi:hypothetical protein